MRSYEVVVGGRLLGLVVPGLPAATPDSPSIEMLEDAMRRQQRAIGHAPEKRAEHADLKASSIEKAHLEYPETCAATAFMRSRDPKDPAREERPEPQPRGEVVRAKPARLVAKIRQQVRPFVQEYAI